MKDRNTKIKFLNKLIYVIQSITGNHLSIKSSKIIAGLEPTKTNEFLQLIGIALQKQLNTTDAIKKYNLVLSTKDKIKNKNMKLVSNNNLTSVIRKSTTDKKNLKTKMNVLDFELQNHNILETLSPKIMELQKFESVVKTDKQQTKVLAQVIDEQEHHPSFNKILDDKNIFSSKSKLMQDGYKTHISNELIMHNSTDLKSRKKKNGELNFNDVKSNNLKSSNYEVSSKQSNETTEFRNEIVKELNTSIFNSNKGNINLDFYEDSFKINQICNENDDIIFVSSSHLLKTRPSSARPAAPKLQTKLDDLCPVYESFTTKIHPNSHVKNKLNFNNNADNFPKLNEANNLQKLYGQEMNFLDQEHGHLVAQILETQKDLTNSINVEVQSATVQTKNEFGIQIERIQLMKEIENLRCNIQQLASASNPLGKLIDLLQENIEIMQKEYFFWIDQNIRLRKSFDIRKKLARKFLEDIKLLLNEKNICIAEEFNKVQLLKIDILKNNDKIKKLINE